MPKIVDHEEYRCVLLRTSFKVAAEVGYGSLSMKQLAQNLEISTGSIYHYFKSKEDWFLSLVAYYSKETLSMLDQEIPVDTNLSDKITLTAVHIEKHKEFYADMVNLISDFFRMRKINKQGEALELNFVSDQIRDHIATLFGVKEATAIALLSYFVGIIMANRLIPRGVNAVEQVPYMCLLLEIPKFQP